MKKKRQKREREKKIEAMKKDKIEEGRQGGGPKGRRT